MNETYFVYGERVTAIKEVEVRGEMYLICEDSDGYVTIYRKNICTKWEDTIKYREQEEAKAKLAELAAKKTALIEQIKKEAVESLSARLRINSAFSPNAAMGAYGIAIANELEKITQDKRVSA
jgi:L-cysteine desulfidase